MQAGAERQVEMGPEAETATRVVKRKKGSRSVEDTRAREELQGVATGSAAEDGSEAGRISDAVTRFVRCESFALHAGEFRKKELLVQMNLLEEAWKRMTMEDQDELLERYVSTKATFLEKLEEPEQEKEISMAQQVAEMKGLEKLPKFSGDYDEWVDFRDDFQTLLGQSKTISASTKLSNLRACLEGDARLDIQGYPITDENYEICWNILREKYESPDRALNAHLRRVGEIEKCAPGDTRALANTVDTCRSKLRCILAMKGMSEAKLGNVMWRKDCEQRLDDETVKAWEFSVKKSEIPTCEELFEFVDRRVRAGMAMEAMSVVTTQAPKQKVFKQEWFNRKCLICNGDHQSQACRKYLSWTLEMRKKEMADRRLCFGCFKRGHVAATCQSSPCSKCQGKHHATLCSKTSSQ